MTIRVNAGPLADEHWLHDPLIGGGRLLGEGCHSIDLFMHCIAQPLASVHAFASPRGRRSLECSDDFTVSLRFVGGGLGTLLYTAEGDLRMGKERSRPSQLVAVWSSTTFGVLGDMPMDGVHRLREASGQRPSGQFSSLSQRVAARSNLRIHDPTSPQLSAALAAMDSLLTGPRWR